MMPSRRAPAAATFFLRQPDWLAAFLLTVIIAGLHFYFLLHAGGLWRDEVNLLNLAAKHSLAAMRQDSFPVLMPLVVSGWTALGLAHDDRSVRLLGTLIGLGIPAALWLAAWSTRRAPPLLGLALFGFNGTLIVFGDSLRAYGLGSLLIMLTSVAAVVLLQRPSWWRAGGLALLATLSVQALYHNAILVGAICVGAGLVCWRKRDGLTATQVFLAGLTAALSLLPYAAGLMAGRESTSVARTGLQSWRFFAAFHDSLGFPLQPYIYVWALLAGLLIFLAGAAWLGKRRNSDASDQSSNDLKLFAGATVLFGFLGYILFLWLAAFPSQSWYLLPLMALAVVCFETGLPDWRGKLRLAFLALIAGTAVIAVPAASRDLHTRFTNVDAQAAELTAAASPDDFVVVVPWVYGITFSHYFHGGTAWTTLPPLTDYATHRYDLVRLQIQNTNAIQPVLERIVTTLRQGHRVWVLAALGWMDVPDPGTSAPASLPPAPSKNFGWSEGPYTMVWASQVAHLLGDHSHRFERVKDSGAGGQIIENTELFVAEGWKSP